MCIYIVGRYVGVYNTYMTIIVGRSSIPRNFVPECLKNIYKKDEKPKKTKKKNEIVNGIVKNAKY